MDQLSPEEVQARIQRIQKILQEFQAEMSDLRNQKHEVIANIVKRIDQGQINQVLKDIHTHDRKKDQKI